MTTKAKVVSAAVILWGFGFGVTPSFWLGWLTIGVFLGLFLTWWLERETAQERRLRLYTQSWSRTRPYRSVKSRR